MAEETISIRSQQLPTSRVVIDDNIYPRAQFDQSTIDEYAELLSNEVDMDPIILDQHYRLLDGYHRLQAHIKLDIEFIEYRIRTVKDDFEAFKIACQLNSKHGKSLTKSDRIKDARHMYEMNCTETQTPSTKVVEEIADALGVSFRSVCRWCKDFKDNIKKKQKEIISETGNNCEAARKTGLTRRGVIKIVNQQKAKPGAVEEKEDLNGVQKARELIKEKGVQAAVEELTQSRRGCEALREVLLENLENPEHPFYAKFKEQSDLILQTDARLAAEHRDFAITIPTFNKYMEELRSYVPACRELLAEKPFKDIVKKAVIIHALNLKDKNMQSEFISVLMPLITELQEILASIDPEFEFFYKAPEDRELYHDIYNWVVDRLLEMLEKDQEENPEGSDN